MTTFGYNKCGEIAGNLLKIIRYQLLSVVLVAALAATGAAQDDPYARVDSMMRKFDKKINSTNDLYKLTHFIREHFDSDPLRLRACFIWITENIAYDVKAFLKEDPIAGQVDYVLEKKRGICGGYAALLKLLCDLFSIECQVVTGYARSEKKVVLPYPGLATNHAWNAVKINGEWRLMDPTWAAGFVVEIDDTPKYFVRRFLETYYFTPPEKFLLNHFPKQNRFQLVKGIMPEMTFRKKPVYTSTFIADSVQKIDPDSAVIRTKVGDTLSIRFKSSIPLVEVCISTENLPNADYSALVTRRDDWYEIRYPVRAYGFYNIKVGRCRETPLVIYRLEAR